MAAQSAALASRITMQASIAQPVRFCRDRHGGLDDVNFLAM
jgi:hypothetical protein